MKKFQKSLGSIYLGGKKSFPSDDFFIIISKGIYCHMYAAEFKGLLYNTLSENPFKSQRINIKKSEYDSTISDFISQRLGMLI